MTDTLRPSHSVSFRRGIGLVVTAIIGVLLAGSLAWGAPLPTLNVSPGLVTWKYVEPGSYGLPEVTIDASVYPDGRGVQFLVNGVIDERTSVRPNGFDATGPAAGSVFHIYPPRTQRIGDVLEARWTDRSGLSWSHQHVVGAPPTTQPPSSTVAVPRLAAWKYVSIGSFGSPEITIDGSVYPDARGVQFWVNGVIDERTSVRPNGFDATGPAAGSVFQIYPRRTQRIGDVLEARWTDRSGVARTDQHVVGGQPATMPPVTTQPATTQPATTQPATTQPATTQPATTQPATTQPATTQPATTQPATTQPATTQPATTQPATTQPATTQPPTTQPPTTQPPTTPASGDFPTFASTGPRVAYSQMKVHQGDFYTTSHGQVVDRMDIRGNLKIVHNNVTVRDTRVMMAYNYGVDIRPVNGVFVTGTRFEYIEIDGRNATDTSVAVYGAGAAWTLDHSRVHNVGSSIHIVRNNTVSNSYIHSNRGTTADIHRNAIQHHGGYGNKVINNTLYCEGNGCSSALALYGEVAAVQDILVEHNLLAATAGYCTYTGSLSYKPYPNGSNVRFINNHFSTKFFPLCGRSGAVTGSTAAVRGNVWQGNVWHETGKPVN